MKRLTLLVILALFIQFTVLSQPCLPDGITFNTQAQIDSFQILYPNCTEIEGDLVVQWNDITNLHGLSVVTSIGGQLRIFNSDSLTSLVGLDNLSYIGGDIVLSANNVLTNLIGLDNLTSLAGSLIIYSNGSLSNLTGLNNLSTIGGGLDIRNNYNLIGTPSLTSLTGLDNVTFIGGTIIISSNTDLTSLAGLNNLTSIDGSLIIGRYGMGFGNNSLTTLTGLDNLTFIGGNFRINDNDSLISLSGLDNLDAASINNLLIYNNTSLSTCEVQSVCDYLVSPNGTIEIYNNATGCNNQQEVEEACESVSIEEQNNLKEATIYPNPTQSSITIELPTQPTKNTILTISNTNGQQLITQALTKPKTEIDISSLPTGIYIVKVWNDKDVMVQKVIKQ